MIQRRIAQFGILIATGGLAVGAGLELSQGGGASSPSVPAPGSTSVVTIPDEIPIAGPNGYEGTVPKSDIVDPPCLTTSGSPPSPSDYPGAAIVLNGNAGYPVTNDGTLNGYWVPGHQPATFVSVSEAESEGAVPSQGASAVGTNTATTPAETCAPPPYSMSGWRGTLKS